MTGSLVRAADETDLRFVLHSWLDSYKFSHAAGLIAVADWRAVMEPQVRRILARAGVSVLVAHHPVTDRTADVYGWVALESYRNIPLVHYVYVKQAYRRMGVAAELLLAAGVHPSDRFYYTCRTAVVGKLDLPRAQWRPLIARHEETPHGRDRNVHAADNRAAETAA